MVVCGTDAALSFRGVVIDSFLVEPHVSFEYCPNDDRFLSKLVDDAITLEDDLPGIVASDSFSASFGLHLSCMSATLFTEAMTPLGENMDTALIEEALLVQQLGDLTGPEIARATGVKDATVRAWLSRTRSPSRGKAAERLLELSSIVERLSKVLETRYIAAWLRKPNPGLNHRKPIDLIAAGRYEEVSRLVAGVEAPPAS